ncbi:MAG: GDSL-type esterase/lipase family protein [Actinomycetota bacterium]
MRRITITMATALMVVATFVTPALAGAPDGPAHIALGDSVAAGSGANSPDTAYVHRLSRYLRSIDCSEATAEACPHLQLIDYSVGGSKSGDLIAEQLGPAVNEIIARQTDGIDHNNVEFITITVGGNDLFEPVITACAAGADANCVNTIVGLFASYQANLAVILGTLRATAPEAEIAIMTYYNPLAACRFSDLAPLADLVLEGGGPLPFGLNDIIRAVASGVGGITVVETYGVLDSSDFVGGNDCLHPDDSGHLKIAKAYRRSMA